MTKGRNTRDATATRAVIASAPELRHAAALAADDVDLASRSSAPLLISASTPGEAEALARYVHAQSARAARPFLTTHSGALPSEVGLLADVCADLLRAGQGGTLYLREVEEAMPSVQTILIELFQVHMTDTVAPRLISGTSIRLFDQVVSGAFSAELFYRLNILHINLLSG
jgi:two-component system response regulator PilR (NtrC family)